MFLRRKDLTVKKRAIIGLTALIGTGIYGTIIDLARDYNISRPFVYELKNKAIEAFETKSIQNDCKKQEEIELVNKLILVMRLCGKSSVGGISESLKLLELPNSSVGYVSEFLNNKSAFLIDDLPVLNKPVTVLADEMFVCGEPVLVVLDAVSHLILAIELAENRTGTTWNTCFQSLIKKGYRIEKVAKDLGSGLAKGIKGLDIISQADIFHLLKNFDPYLGSLEKKAEGAIEAEEKALNVLNNRKTEAAELKSMKKYFDIIDDAEEKINEYDNYDFLHTELHIAFNTFDNDGTFRNQEKITEDIMAISALMKESFTNHDGIKSATAFLCKHLHEYFPYIVEIENILKTYNDLLPRFLVKEVCLAYQKSLKSIAIKDYQLAKKIKNEADEHMKLSLMVAKNENEKTYIACLVTKLNECIRSSSALEAKNSVIRKYSNSLAGQITQKHLNLIAFYMNRKVAIRGKYKGRSPIERFSGIEEEFSFLELLLQQ